MKLSFLSVIELLGGRLLAFQFQLGILATEELNYLDNLCKQVDDDLIIKCFQYLFKVWINLLHTILV